jgi:hypothetical protein
MELERFIEALQADLEGIAGVGDDAASEAARRLTGALRSSAGLRLLDVLSEAALELTSQLPDAHVEVRLVGQDPSLVYVPDEGDAPSAPAAGEDTPAARITLRLPEGLKASIEVAATREGVSVNTWLIRALARAVGSGGQRRGPGNRLTGFGRS